MKKCKYCGGIPVIADVGGNIPYYEITCKCHKSVVVGSYKRAEAITTWNILMGGKNNYGGN